MSRDMRPLFLLSLPRSGSTLVQRMLGAHREVATVSEPHLLLSLVYSLGKEGVYAEYNHKLASMALEDFCDALPAGRQDYLNEVRRFALSLYGKAGGEQGSYFLDKTPRYSLIAKELFDIFPDGKFIFLWRNPLAVLSSVLEQSKDGRWQGYGAKVDLLKGLVNLVEAYREQEGRAHAVRYEDLVADPAGRHAAMLRYLDLPEDAAAVRSFAEVELKGRLGDKRGYCRYRSVASEPLEKWKRNLSNPLRKAWCRHYLRWFGRDRLAVMGYSLDSLLDEVRGIPTTSHMLLSDLLHMPLSFVYSFVEPRLMREKMRMLLALEKIFVHY